MAPRIGASPDDGSTAAPLASLVGRTCAAWQCPAWRPIVSVKKEVRAGKPACVPRAVSWQYCNSVMRGADAE